LDGRDHTTSFFEIVMPAFVGELEAEILEGVEHLGDRRRAHRSARAGRRAPSCRRFFIDVFDENSYCLGSKLVAHRLDQRPLDAVVVDDPADGS